MPTGTIKIDDATEGQHPAAAAYPGESKSAATTAVFIVCTDRQKPSAAGFFSAQAEGAQKVARLATEKPNALHQLFVIHLTDDDDFEAIYDFMPGDADVPLAEHLPTETAPTASPRNLAR